MRLRQLEYHLQVQCYGVVKLNVTDHALGPYGALPGRSIRYIVNVCWQGEHPAGCSPCGFEGWSGISCGDMADMAGTWLSSLSRYYRRINGRNKLNTGFSLTSVTLMAKVLSNVPP